MNKNLHKRIKIFSIIAMVLISLASIAGILILRSGRIEIDYVILDVEITWAVSILFPIISIIVSFSIIHEEKTWIRKISKYVFYAYPVIVVIAFLGLYFASNTILIVTTVVLLVFLTILALIEIFVFGSAISLTSTVVFLSLIIIGIVFKRFHLPFAGPVLITSLILFSLGCYMYGIRCLYIAEENKFLKYMVFLGSCIVAISLMGLLFKFQHWPFNNQMVSAGRISLVIWTIIVLLALPSSGFIEWKPLHKMILRRLILPWALLFLLFIIKFLLPEFDAILWTKETRVINTGFGMTDYKIEIRNNLKPE